MEIQLEFVTGQNEDGEDITIVKTFVNNKVKSRVLREAVDLNSKIDFNDLKGTDMDTLVDFTCNIYKNKFNRDEFYDGLDASKMIDTLTNIIEDVVNGAENRLATFPKEQ